jgi:hypothetical protein
MPVVGTLLLLSVDRDFRAVHTRYGWRPSNFTLGPSCRSREWPFCAEEFLLVPLRQAGQHDDRNASSPSAAVLTSKR